MSDPKRLWWVIEGRSGFTTLFREVVTFGQLNEPAIVKLLQHLASRDLEPREIISSSIRRSAKARTDLLQVTKEQGARKAIFSIGHDPHYIIHSCTDHQMREYDEHLHHRLTKKTARAKDR